MSDVINALTSDTIRDVMQNAGYRVEAITDSAAGIELLRSATNGLNFDIRFGNKLAGENGYADVALVAIFKIVGEFPLGPINEWNNTRRFGRLQIDKNISDQSFLVLCMDVSAAGGVTRAYVRTQIEIWDGLVQQLVPWLREQIVGLAQVNGASPGASLTEPKPSQSESSRKDERVVSGSAAN